MAQKNYRRLDELYEAVEPVLGLRGAIEKGNRLICGECGADPCGSGEDDCLYCKTTRSVRTHTRVLVCPDCGFESHGQTRVSDEEPGEGSRTIYACGGCMAGWAVGDNNELLPLTDKEREDLMQDPIYRWALAKFAATGGCFNVG